MRSAPLYRLLLVAAILLTGSFSTATAEIVFQGTIPAQWPTDVNAPVTIPAPPTAGTPKIYEAEVTIAGQETSQTVIAQGDDQVWMFLSFSAEDRGKAVTVRLKPCTQNPSPAYRCTYADPRVLIQTPDDQTILSYWHGDPGQEQPYALTDYIDAIRGMDGEVLTDVRPKDHRHHRGIYWAWVRHEQDGRKLGDWWQPKNLVCEPGDVATAEGPTFASFQARHWLTHQPEGEQTSVRFLQQDVACRVFPATPWGRAVDIDLTLTALADGIHIGGTPTLNKGYGGMTVRFAPAKYPFIETPHGLLTADGIQHRDYWADWNGYFAQPTERPAPHRSGLAVLIHPSHPDNPPNWLLRHYGVLNVSYPGLDMLEIPRDNPLKLRYRLWVHRGNASQGRVDAQYRAYRASWNWKQIQAN